jgi:hypothetical protein
VRIDGVAVDSADWRVVNEMWLKRISQAWPGQNLSVADGETGTWSVDMQYGAVPPILGVLAAKSLACWLAATDPANQCRLPAHVRSLSRQGINQQFDAKISGGFALADVSLFLQSVPLGSADVWSPDLSPLPPEVL